MMNKQITDYIIRAMKELHIFWLPSEDVLKSVAEFVSKNPDGYGEVLLKALKLAVHDVG